ATQRPMAKAYRPQGHRLGSVGPSRSRQGALSFPPRRGGGGQCPPYKASATEAKDPESIPVPIRQLHVRLEGNFAELSERPAALNGVHDLVNPDVSYFA